MNTQERINQLQSQANKLAIEESNLAEQIKAGEAARMRAEQINREKHQILGALAILREQAAEAQAEKAKAAA